MNILNYIDRGGIIVYILIIFNIVGFTIMIWKIYVLYKAKRNIFKLSDIICKSINNDLLDPIIYVKNFVSSEVQRLESGLSTVKLIASISPLIGLLGTVIGILNSFDSITKLGLGDPTIFSSGISIALITTITGLVVAIPHYIGYNYFMGALDSFEIKLEQQILDKLK